MMLEVAGLPPWSRPGIAEHVRLATVGRALQPALASQRIHPGAQGSGLLASVLAVVRSTSVVWLHSPNGIGDRLRYMTRVMADGPEPCHTGQYSGTAKGDRPGARADGKRDGPKGVSA